jgi:hypothetical protein
MTARKDEINARGHANGAYAQQLKNRAVSTKTTMAALFDADIQYSLAFNVPATCTHVTTQWICYRFLDGSTGRYANLTH